MPQWVHNVLLPLFIAFAIPTLTTVAESGAREQRLMQVEEGIGRLLQGSEEGRVFRTEMLERQARTEEKVHGLQKSVDRIATMLLKEGA